MKVISHSTFWPGAVLACVLVLSFDTMTSAAKPPPKPAPSPAYVAVLLGGLRSGDGTIEAYAFDINNAGQVVGRIPIPGYGSGYSQAFLIDPRDVNGDGKPEWFADAVDNATGAPGSDGQNDLIIPLGTLPAQAGNGRNGSANAVNDRGQVVGISSEYNTQSGSQEAFIVVPKDTDGDGQADCWYEDSDGDGFNDLMLALGRPEGVPGSSYPVALNINNGGQVTGWFSDRNGTSRCGFLLTPEDTNGDGTPDLWYRQGSESGVNALMVNLGTFIPKSLNDAGQIVGMTALRGAVLRNPDGSMVDLKPGGTAIEFLSINHRGQIGLSFQLDVGHAGLLTPLDANKDGTADTWFQDTNGDGANDLIVDLGALSGLENTYVAVHGLNDTGSVVGGSWHASRRDGLGYQRGGFLWENGVIQSLKNLTGGTLEIRDAYAINNARQIISEIAGGRDDPGLYACILLPTR